MTTTRSGGHATVPAGPLDAAERDEIERNLPRAVEETVSGVRGGELARGEQPSLQRIEGDPVLHEHKHVDVAGGTSGSLAEHVEKQEVSRERPAHAVDGP
jgi:hypothetical protein